jgi:hypothetical protein
MWFLNVTSELLSSLITKIKEIYCCQCDNIRSTGDWNTNTGIYQVLHRGYMADSERCENNTGTTN